ncbi:hypothetical protein CQW23_03278 [Capsicum baccatum]|uniref:Uncharacterized protein n=1 Tax=Capsicum baccatum TaxID=33114 RepID=A0A2G2XBB2_CAPBA|nr:hypothetical protein CQW23_03278 [Capsicum baccatum]
MRILLGKLDAIIPFTRIPHSYSATRAYSSFHNNNNNTVQGKVGEISNLEVDPGIFEVGKVKVGESSHLEVDQDGTLSNGYYRLWKNYQLHEAHTECNRVSEMTIVMKEMDRWGYSLYTTKAVLLANIIRENTLFLDMMVEKSRRELTHAIKGIEKEISALQSEVCLDLLSDICS